MADTFIAPEVNSYRYVISPNEKLKKGDTVYLWLSYDPCFYGLGTVAETPKLFYEEISQDKRRRHSVLVSRAKELTPRITERIMRGHRHLKRIIPSGFDDLYAIPLQKVQANYLNDFITEHGLESPEGSVPLKMTIEEPEPQFMPGAERRSLDRLSKALIQMRDWCASGGRDTNRERNHGREAGGETCSSIGGAARVRSGE